VLFSLDETTSERTVPYLGARRTSSTISAVRPRDEIDQLWSGEILCPPPEPPPPPATYGGTAARVVGWTVVATGVVAAWSWAILRWAAS
jgi:hypothetical protein